MSSTLGYIYEYANGSSTPTTFASNLGNPQGLAFDSSGNLYAADWSGNILKFSPGGNESTFATLPNSDGPNFLVFAPATAGVPESSTLLQALGGLILGGLGLLARRRKR